MITVLSRPQGHKLADPGPTGTVTNDGGEALVTAVAHGLVDGDWIYVQSDFESYNGFKQVADATYSTFKLVSRGAPVAYKQDAEISYRVSVLDHGWQAVHNPIVYELESDLSPNNIPAETYTPVTVVSQSDQEGYTDLHLSTGVVVSELGFIELIGTGALAGVYQITEKIHPWELVINLAYDAANSFSSYTVVPYYSNYVINVNVWAGLDPAHPWEDEKPYEIAAALKFTPDQNGRAKFSIADILRGYITTRNNLLLDSLPNNLDFFVGFFIEYWESYDIVTAGEILTFNASATDDDFVGTAVNSSMPFKSQDVSHMSDYINFDIYLARWLVLQERPIMIVGRFFDISFLKSFIGDFILTINKYLNNVQLATEDIDFVDNGIGVYRLPIVPDPAYDKFCIFVKTVDSTPTPDVIVGITLPALSTWTTSGGAGTAWTTGATPTVNLIGAGLPGVSSEYLIADYAFTSGKIYKVGFRYTKDINSGSSNPRNITLAALDSLNNVIFSQVEATPTADGTQFVVLIFTATSQTTRLGITSTDGSNVDIDINALQPQLLANSEFDDASIWTPADWVLGSGAAVITIFSGDSGILLQNITGTVAGSYSFMYSRTSTDYAIGPDSSTLGVTFYDEFGANIAAGNYAEFISGNNTTNFVWTFTSAVPVRKIQVIMVHGTGSDMTNTFSYMRLFGPSTETTPGNPDVTGAQITEEICIDILNECDNTLLEPRLLEDEFFRLLE